MSAAQELAQEMRTRALALAGETSWEALLEEAYAIARNVSGADGRAVDWRCRLRLYDYGGDLAEAVADSDAELPADQAGRHVIASLPAVVSWIRELATAFHGNQIVGLDADTLRRRVGSLRSQMSTRGNGTGTLRLDYSVVETRLGGQHTRRMLARCDIQRVQPNGG